MHHFDVLTNTLNSNQGRIGIFVYSVWDGRIKGNGEGDDGGDESRLILSESVVSFSWELELSESLEDSDVEVAGLGVLDG